MTENRDEANSKLYTGVVHDVLRARGLGGQALPSALRPVVTGRVLVGEVYTVEGAPDPDIGADESLLAWTGFLSDVPSGRIVVCQPNDSALAHMGELSAETLRYRGVLGYIVDGGCRDTAFIEQVGFPVWCRYRTPVDIVGQWRVTALREAVTVGSIRVESGDFAVADDDGVVIVPGDVADEVLREATEMTMREDRVRAAILTGVPPRDAYLQYGKF